MAPYQLVVLIIVAVGVQFGMLSMALLIEFSARKSRPRQILQPPRQPHAPAGRRATAKPSHRPATVTRISPASKVPPAGEVETESQPEASALPPQPAAAPPEPLVAQEPEAHKETAAGLTPAMAPPTEEIPLPKPAEPEPQEPVAEARPAGEQAPAEPPRDGIKAAEPAKIGLGLRRTREGFLSRLRAAITGSAKLDEIYEGLEEALIGADVGVDTSVKIVEAVRQNLKNDPRPDTIRDALRAEIARILSATGRPLADAGPGEPLVVMLAGVNGAGKTTTIAKLAAIFKEERGPVVVAAADTFRAAAIDQLEVWCQRVGVEIIKQSQGSDPAAVAFDAVKAARSRQASTVLVDTAGRLQTKVNLMEELKKIARVIGRELPGAPHETWLVLDATTGQNALSQARLFGDAVKLTGVVLAKLDSSAKGGVIVGIAEQLKLPVRYVGLGERVEDLRPFDPEEFVNALFGDEAGSASGSYAA